MKKPVTIEGFAKAILGEEKGAEVLEEVRTNHELLLGCELPHRFETIEEDGVLHREMVCTSCAGKVPLSHGTWYQRGLQDAAMDQESDDTQ